MLLECYGAFVLCHSDTLGAKALVLLDRMVQMLSKGTIQHGIGELISRTVLKMLKTVPENKLSGYLTKISKILSTATKEQREECYIILDRLMPYMKVDRDIMDGIISSGLISSTPSKSLEHLIHTMSLKNPAYASRCKSALSKVLSINNMNAALVETPEMVMSTTSSFSSTTLKPELMGVTMTKNKSGDLKGNNSTESSKITLKNAVTNIQRELSTLFENYPLYGSGQLSISTEYQYYKQFFAILIKYRYFINCVSITQIEELTHRLLDIATRAEYNDIAIYWLKMLNIIIKDKNLLLDVRFTIFEKLRKGINNEEYHIDRLDECLYSPK